MPTYYMAAGFNDKAILRELAAQVCRESGKDNYPAGPWVCNSRWLMSDEKNYSVGKTREEKAEHGYMDIEDIDNAHAVVLISNESVGGGKWVELGYALATNKPVIYWQVQGLQSTSNKINPFVHAKCVAWAGNVDEVVKYLRSIAIIGGEAYFTANEKDVQEG